MRTGLVIKVSLGLLAVLAMVSCGRLQGTGSGDTGAASMTGEEGPGLPGTNWDTWFPDAERTTPDSDSYKALPFPARAPQNLGPSMSTYLSDSGNAVAFVADLAEFGRVLVLESAPDITDPAVRERAYEDAVQQNGSPGIQGEASITTVRDGILALVTTAQDESRSTLEFVDGSVQYMILGPSLGAVAEGHIADGLYE
jgi:hypothetical protein